MRERPFRDWTPGYEGSGRRWRERLGDEERSQLDSDFPERETWDQRYRRGEYERYGNETDYGRDHDPRGGYHAQLERGERYGYGAGGMSLDDGRFVTRPQPGYGGPRRTGNAPKGYKRSDDRIREDVCDRLSERWDVESREIEVSVSNGEVTLSGSVPERGMKFRAESISDGVSGVLEVHNQLRVAMPQYGRPSANERDLDAQAREGSRDNPVPMKGRS